MQLPASPYQRLRGPEVSLREEERVRLWLRLTGEWRCVFVSDWATLLITIIIHPGREMLISEDFRLHQQSITESHPSELISSSQQFTVPLLELISSPQTTQSLINGMKVTPNNNLIRPLRKSFYLLCDLKYLPSLPLLALHSQVSHQLKVTHVKNIHLFIFYFHKVT